MYFDNKHDRLLTGRHRANLSTCIWGIWESIRRQWCSEIIPARRFQRHRHVAIDSSCSGHDASSPHSRQTNQPGSVQWRAAPGDNNVHWVCDQSVGGGDGQVRVSDHRGARSRRGSDGDGAGQKRIQTRDGRCRRWEQLLLKRARLFKEQCKIPRRLLLWPKPKIWQQTTEVHSTKCMDSYGFLTSEEFLLCSY